MKESLVKKYNVFLVRGEYFREDNDQFLNGPEMSMSDAIFITELHINLIKVGKKQKSEVVSQYLRKYSYRCQSKKMH